MTDSGGATATLARYAAGLRCTAHPADVIERARHVILDTCGALVSGAQLEPGRAILSFAATLADRPEATVACRQAGVSATNAAFLNGALAHADETDDSHFSSMTHPAAMAVPAALGVGEPRAIDGATLVASVVAGYDVQCRVAKAMGPNNVQRRGFMALAVCGSFGAAAAAGRALGLTERQMTCALGFAGLQAGGLWACAEEPGHYAKALQSGFPTRNGVTAALLAAHDIPAPAAILEGPNNAIAAFSDAPDYAQLTADLGRRFEILGTSIKKHACGGPIRGPVDGLLALMAEHQLSAADLERVDVRLAHSAVRIVGGRAIPSISTAYVLAVAAHDRYVSIEQTHSPRRTQDPSVLALADRIEVHGDDELEQVFPALRPAIVSVSTRDGRMLTTRVDYAAGSPERPMTQEEVEEKFLRLAVDVLGRKCAHELVNCVRRLETLPDIRTFTALLRSAD